MNKQEAFVRSTLGDGIEDVTLTVFDRSWQGWERWVRPGELLESEIAAPLAEHQLFTTLVEQYWLSFHNFNIRLWSNFGLNIRAIPEMPVLEILKYEGVGMHNQSDKSMRKTHEAMALIYDQRPFEILFADPAGLKAAFLEPVTEQQAFEFEDLIYTVAWESFAALPQEYQEDEQGIPLLPSMAEYILEEQQFLLWWD